MRGDLQHMDRFARRKADDGAQYLINRNGVTLTVIASWGGGWDHVSVSNLRRCPSWEEMHWVKQQFFESDEVVMQLHPAESNYINLHPYVLHLWRPQNATIPTPPLEYV